MRPLKLKNKKSVLKGSSCMNKVLSSTPSPPPHTHTPQLQFGKLERTVCCSCCPMFGQIENAYIDQLSIIINSKPSLKAFDNYLKTSMFLRNYSNCRFSDVKTDLQRGVKRCARLSLSCQAICHFQIRATHITRGE